MVTIQDMIQCASVHHCIIADKVHCVPYKHSSNFLRDNVESATEPTHESLLEGSFFPPN